MIIDIINSLDMVALHPVALGLDNFILDLLPHLLVSLSLLFNLHISFEIPLNFLLDIVFSSLSDSVGCILVLLDFLPCFESLLSVQLELVNSADSFFVLVLFFFLNQVSKELVAGAQFLSLNTLHFFD